MCHKIFHLLPVAAALALFAGCQSVPKVQFSGDPTIQVGKFNTFFIDEFPRDNPQLDDAAKDILTTIEDYIATVLTEKGYTQAATMEEADFALVPRGRAVPSTSIAGAQFGNYGTGGWLSGTPWGTSSTNEESGTIMVICFALQTEKIVWVGWAKSKTTQGSINRLKAFQTAATVLSEIVVQFPAHTP